MRETKMRQFTISAATLTVFAALLATAPAQAEISGGGPTQNGSQCFKYSSGGNDKDGRFGLWTACPQTASTPVATPRQTRRHRAAAR
jgi:hypothetical protein